MALIAVATSAVGYIGQVQAASQQAEYQQQLVNENARQQQVAAMSANENARLNWNQTSLKEQQQRAQLINDNLQTMINLEEVKGTATAGNMNRGGSFDSLLLDYEGQMDRYEGVTDANMRMLGMQAASERFAIGKQAEAQANSISQYVPSPVQEPSLGAAVIGGVSGALQYNDIKWRKALPKFKGGI